MYCEEKLAECMQDLLGAAAHMEPEAYRSWAAARVCNLLSLESVDWHLGQPLHEACGRGQDSEPHEFTYRGMQGFSGVAFLLRFRRCAGQSFAEEERRVLTALASQACGAWGMATQLTLLRQNRRERCAEALVDADGHIHALQGPFHEALRASWPAWRSGALPPDLRAPTAQGDPLHVGLYRWSVEAAGRLLRVSAEPRGGAASLTSREQSVATAVLECGSQKSAAAALGVSPHTVRNTLVRVYSKLGVRNRVELALRLRPAAFRRVDNASGGRSRTAGI